MQPALQLLSARKLHAYELPPDWICIAAINPEQDEYQVKIAIEDDGSVTIAGVAQRSGANCNSIVARTSFSPVRIFLPADAAYDVTARTSFGRIRSDFPLTMSSGTQLGGSSVTSVAITSKLGAGGCELRLTNANGNIDLLDASGSSALRDLRERDKDKDKDKDKKN